MAESSKSGFQCDGGLTCIHGMLIHVIVWLHVFNGSASEVRRSVSDERNFRLFVLFRSVILNLRFARGGPPRSTWQKIFLNDAECELTSI